MTVEQEKRYWEAVARQDDAEYERLRRAGARFVVGGLLLFVVFCVVVIATGAV